MRSLCIYLRSEFGYIFYLFYIIIILNLCGKIRKFNINKFILYYLIINKMDDNNIKLFFCIVFSLLDRYMVYVVCFLM